MKTTHRRVRALARACHVALAVSLPLACSSNGASPAAGGGNSSQGHGGVGGTGTGGSPGTGGSGTTPCTPGASLAPARLMLITDNQYRNIMRDAFGVTFPTDMNVTSPPGTSGNYTFNESGQVQATTLQAYTRAADEVAKLVPSFSTCAPDAVDATCMEKFLRDKLPLAWRRPVTDSEIAGLIAIFNSGAMDGKPRQIQLTLQAALLHPALLYRSEIGVNAATTVGKVALTPYELASAVSFALLGSVPDPELWAKAADGHYFAAGLLNLTPEQILRANAQQKSVLDFGLEGLRALQTQAPKSQLPKVQAHIDAIRELEMNLTANTGMCTPPTFAGGPITPSPGMFSQPSQQGGYKEVGALDAQTFPIWQQHKEIIKTMFQCDLTRVVSFTFGYGNTGIHFMNHVLDDPALVGKYKDANGNAITNPNGHHDVSHNVGAGAADAQFIIDKYHCDRTADLLALLAATPDIGGGTLLDNTLVVFWSEVSDGNAHGIHDLPVLLFGGKFLKLQGGSYLQLGNATEHAQFKAAGHYSKGPAPYTTDLWTTTAKAFGHDLPTWGDASWNTGSISGIFGA